MLDRVQHCLYKNALIAYDCFHQLGMYKSFNFIFENNHAPGQTGQHKKQSSRQTKIKMKMKTALRIFMTNIPSRYYAARRSLFQVLEIQPLQTIRHSGSQN